MYGIIKKWAREGHGVSSELYLVCETLAEAENEYYTLLVNMPSNMTQYVRYTIETLRVLDEYDD